MLPEGVQPSADLDLDAQIQPLIVAITGLDGTMVRPRWQPIMPLQPKPSDDWCAIGVSRVEAKDYPVITADTPSFSKHEEIEYLATFYGQNAMHYASLLRDGFSIPQNCEGLTALGMAYVGASDITPLAELINQQWVRRCDMRITLRRKVTRNYQILTLTSADVVSHTDNPPATFTTHVTN